MVLFVTEKIVNINDSIDKLCKQIVNIENNKNIIETKNNNFFLKIFILRL